MLYLNLDSLFLFGEDDNQVRFTNRTFPGGESNIRLASVVEGNDVTITQRIRTGQDVMDILMAADACKRDGCRELKLIIPYLPYARQDRKCNSGEAFSLKIFCDMINSVYFDDVYVYDAHSDVGPALLDNCTNIDNHKFIQNVVHDMHRENMCGPLTIVAPDAGAVKKIYKLMPGISHFAGTKLVVCDKVRNLATGEILRTMVYADKIEGHCLIIDDICDGGRTMIEVAKVLKEKGAQGVSMAVSHGIFSKGIGVLNDFDYIYTTNSFASKWENSEDDIKTLESGPEFIPGKDKGFNCLNIQDIL